MNQYLKVWLLAPYCSFNASRHWFIPVRNFSEKLRNDCRRDDADATLPRAVRELAATGTTSAAAAAASTAVLPPSLSPSLSLLLLSQDHHYELTPPVLAKTTRRPKMGPAVLRGRERLSQSEGIIVHDVHRPYNSCRVYLHTPVEQRQHLSRGGSGGGVCLSILFCRRRRRRQARPMPWRRRSG